MILTLDSNVLIDVMRQRREPVRKNLDRALKSRTSLVVSLIVYHELMYGAALSRDMERQSENIRKALFGISVESFDEEDMARAALVRAALKSTGRPIGPFDSLIAGQALARGWTVVTANTGEFHRVPGLTVIDWSQETD